MQQLGCASPCPPRRPGAGAASTVLQQAEHLRSAAKRQARAGSGERSPACTIFLVTGAASSIFYLRGSGVASVTSPGFLSRASRMLHLGHGSSAWSPAGPDPEHTRFCCKVAMRWKLGQPFLSWSRKGAFCTLRTKLTPILNHFFQFLILMFLECNTSAAGISSKTHV